ncbi:MAG: hypothetical protein EOP00_18790 [Pedobacter sp.]|nr:MAG: hypothetical protein EOP00_18790 [Pedobacter sp.]
MFFFDFVSINVGETRNALTGFSLFKNEVIGYNVCIILVFLLGLTGFIVSSIDAKTKYGIGFLLALAATILLLVNQFLVIEKYSILGTIKFELAYWICLISFVFACCSCYLLQYKTVHKGEVIETKGVVNINIITQSNKVSEK